MALALKKYIDLPVFLLANIAVDLEVLAADKWPVHQHWHFHTLLIGVPLGVVLAVAMYPLRHLFEKAMKLLGLAYKCRFWKMLIAGVLGVWLHVAIDSMYHWDVQTVWPSNAKPLYRLLSQSQVKSVCIACWVAAIVLYLVLVLRKLKKVQKS
ncbi:hypothetical protein ACFL3G_04815 [Planctomycetota bacterium]